MLDPRTQTPRMRATMTLARASADATGGQTQKSPRSDEGGLLKISSLRSQVSALKSQLSSLLILNVDRDIHTSWEVELFKLVHGRSGWLDDVDQALVRAENGSL